MSPPASSISLAPEARALGRVVVKVVVMVVVGRVVVVKVVGRVVVVKVVGRVAVKVVGRVVVKVVALDFFLAEGTTSSSSVSLIILLSSELQLL